MLDFGNGIAQFVASWTNPASLDSTSIRIDHFINEKLKLFFRFSDTGSLASTRGNVVNSGTPSMYEPLSSVLRTYTLGASSIFSSHVSNDLRFGNRTTNKTTSSIVLDGFGGATPVNFAQTTGLGPGSVAEVILLYAGTSGAYLYQQQASGGQSQWNLVDTVGLSLGRHQFKLGIDYRRLAPFVTIPTPSAAYFYPDQSAVTANTPSTLVDSFAPAYPLYVNFSAFAADEWRWSPRLSFSFGLRLEVNPAPGVTRGLHPILHRSWNESWYVVTCSAGRTPLENHLVQLRASYRNGLHTPRREKKGDCPARRRGVFFDTGQQVGLMGI